MESQLLFLQVRVFIFNAFLWWMSDTFMNSREDEYPTKQFCANIYQAKGFNYNEM